MGKKVKNRRANQKIVAASRKTSVSLNAGTSINGLKNPGYVFISYSSKNRKSAYDIINILNKNGIATWVDTYNIPAGSKYPVIIKNAIENCSCFLLILTEAAQKSLWVAKEVERAVNYGKVIIPIKLEDVVLSDEFEMYISTYQAKIINRIDENTSEIQELIKELKTHTVNNG